MTNFSLLLFASLIVQISAFYAPQFPYSYQRYMDESRSFLRPGAPLPIASFMPGPAFVVIDESAPPLPTPLPLRGNEESSEVSVPRRALRRFADETHQFKRMRPCFYSPIQCLVKKRSVDEDQKIAKVNSD